MIGRLSQRQSEVQFGPVRSGDLSYFVCDIGRARSTFGWQPEVPPEDGVAQTHPMDSGRGESLQSWFMKQTGMKALVLAAGRDRRLDDTTAEINKCMLRLFDKPLIQYSLENAVAAGVDQIIIVVGYRAEEIINHFGTWFKDTPVKYVIQTEQRGLVHAMACAQHAIDGSDFMLFLADEILSHPHHSSMLQAFRDEALFVICGAVFVEDRSQITKTYTLLGDDVTRRIYRLIEKPRLPVNNIMGTGNCIIRPEIFDYLERTPINVQRGERELPDLIQCAVDEGNLVKYFDIGDGYLNINLPEDTPKPNGCTARNSRACNGALSRRDPCVQRGEDHRGGGAAGARVLRCLRGG